MRQIITILMAVTTLALGACSRTDTESQGSRPAMAQNQDSMAGMQHSMDKQSDHNMEMNASKDHAMVQLPTIQCENCKATIEDGLVKTAGILSVQVDLVGKMAHINYDGTKLSLKEIEQAIAKLGYKANETHADSVAYEKLPECCKIKSGTESE